MFDQVLRAALPARHTDLRPAGPAPELPSAAPLMALSTGFWAFKALAAAHELDLFSRLAGSAGTTAEALAEALGLHPRPARCCSPPAPRSGCWRRGTAFTATRP